jgi:predicted DNA-binding protein
MADAHRVMIRLSPELYAQLAARGSSGQPLAAIVREALLAYLAQQPRAAPEQPE